MQGIIEKIVIQVRVPLVTHLAITSKFISSASFTESLAFSFSLSAYLALAAATEVPKAGDKLPSIELPVPKSVEERTYLGLESKDFFTIPEIEADVVIIYFFSYYCHFCAQQVSYVNELYRIIDKNPDLRKKIKFIGIGIRNTPQEIEAYRTKYNLSFPLFPDADFSIHEAYGNITCPHFIAVKIKENGTHEVICCKYAFRDARDFLKLILKNSDIRSNVVSNLNNKIQQYKLQM